VVSILTLLTEKSDGPFDCNVVALVHFLAQLWLGVPVDREKQVFLQRYALVFPPLGKDFLE
jgi:hypothetical protein